MPFTKNNSRSRRVGKKSLPIVRAASRKQPELTSVHALPTKHLAFVPLLCLVFIIWCVYRYLFRFPVWFDETVGKAIFFGLPVVLYVSLTRGKSIAKTVSLESMQPGLLMGLAVGGIFGFAGTLVALLQKGVVVQSAPLFTSNMFWWEFFLAIATSFWESLFFYGWIMTVVGEKMKKWPVVNQALLVAVIFLCFHLPNTLLRFELKVVVGQLVLLFFFGLGQAFLFYRTKNVYALTLSQAIWGMVLLIHTR